MEQYLSNAALVVEGRVLDETFAVRNPQTGSIETVHTIFIDRILKGSAAYNSVEVHTPGGRLDDIIESVSHGSTLSGGQKGIYLLSPNSSSGYHLHGGNAGKITRLKYDDDYEAIHWGELDKYKSWRQLREQVGESLGVDLTIHALTAAELQAMNNDKEFCVKLDNPVPNIEDMTVEFDVMAKSSVPGLKFARAEVIIDYPTGNLGDFIVDQEKIEAGKGDITDGPAYTVAVEDKSEDQIELSIESPCDNSEPHYVLDTVYEKLATLTIEVNEWGDFGTMNVNDFSVAGVAEYVNPATFQGTPGCTEFDDLCGEGEFPILACDVDELSGIYHVGVRDKLELKGGNFDQKPNKDGYISVPNPDNGGATNLVLAQDSRYIDEWVSDKIVVNLSSLVENNDIADGASPLASGDWTIIHDGAVIGGRCKVNVKIDYALENRDETIDNIEYLDRLTVFSSRPSMSANGLVNYYVNNTPATLNSAGVTEMDFIAVVQAAFCKWEEATGIDFNYVGTTTLGKATDNFTVVGFGPMVEASHQAETNRQRLGVGDCIVQGPNPDVAPDPIVGSFAQSGDIVLNIENLWYAGLTGQPGGSLDVYTVVLHEIGHLIGHEHVIGYTANGNYSRDPVMFYKRNVGETVRNLEAAAIAGGNLIKQKSIETSEDDACIEINSLAINSTGNCTVTQTSSTLSPFAEKESNLGIVLNVNQEYPIAGVAIVKKIYKMTGELVYEGQSNTVLLSSSGVYLLEGQDRQANIVRKIIIAQ